MSAKTVRVDTVPWIPGACLVGSNGLGVPPASLPFTGPDGPPFGLSDLEDGEKSREVRWLITQYPQAGILEMLEDSSFAFYGAPLGVYSFFVLAYADGVIQKEKEIVIQYGEPINSIELRLNLT